MTSLCMTSMYLLLMPHLSQEHLNRLANENNT